MRASSFLITLASLASITGQASAATPDLRGRWIGSLHTMQGTCPDQHNSTLVIARDHLSFAPADGVLVLRGTRRDSNPDHLHAQLRLPGVDHKPVPMVFEAHPEGDAIVGLYGTPSC